MKRSLLSILLSVVFVPAVILGQLIGHFGGEIFYKIYSTVGLNLPVFMFTVAPDILAGFAGGALAAFVCSKIYKKYHPSAILVIPLLLSVLSFVGPLLNMDVEGSVVQTIGYALSNLCVFIAFYYVLRNFYPTKFEQDQSE